MLVGSTQDHYVPSQSARIQQTDPESCFDFTEYSIDSREGVIYDQMAQNILSKLSVSNIHRIDVHFEINSRYVWNSVKWMWWLAGKHISSF